MAEKPVADTETPVVITPKPEKSDVPVEIGGGKGLDPTRYGDWEIGGKCVDF